ncbi:hypothetical protein J6590_025716 [Homalodisca vitripennis]|nr:hypothetical protein J6590_025716 [Homalodisca vitripennis]
MQDGVLECGGYHHVWWEICDFLQQDEDPEALLLRATCCDPIYVYRLCTDSLAIIEEVAFYLTPGFITRHHAPGRTRWLSRSADCYANV